MNEGALANLDYDKALSQIASGVLSKTIAAEYHVTPRGLRKALANHPDYAQAVKDQAQSIVEDAVQYVQTCDAETVPIARVRADTAFKYAAARDPANWGAKATLIPIDGQQLVDAAIGQLAGALLTRMHMIEMPAIVDNSAPDQGDSA